MHRSDPSFRLDGGISRRRGVALILLAALLGAGFSLPSSATATATGCGALCPMMAAAGDGASCPVRMECCDSDESPSPLPAEARAESPQLQVVASAATVAPLDRPVEASVRAARGEETRPSGPPLYTLHSSLLN